MPQKLKPRKSLSRTARYYRDNPEARKKHRKSSAKANKKPAAVKKRVESKRARRKARREGKDLTDLDAAHTKNGIVFKHYKKNRGSKGDSPGDKRARGSKRKKKS